MQGVRLGYRAGAAETAHGRGAQPGCGSLSKELRIFRLGAQVKRYGQARGFALVRRGGGRD